MKPTKCKFCTQTISNMRSKKKFCSSKCRSAFFYRVNQFKDIWSKQLNDSNCYYYKFNNLKIESFIDKLPKSTIELQPPILISTLSHHKRDYYKRLTQKFVQAYIMCICISRFSAQPKHNIQKLVDKLKTIKKEFKAFPGEHQLTLFIKKLYKRVKNVYLNNLKGDSVRFFIAPDKKTDMLAFVKQYSK